MQKPEDAELYEACYRETDSFTPKPFYGYIFLSDNDRNLPLVPTYARVGGSRKEKSEINEGPS